MAREEDGNASREEIIRKKVSNAIFLDVAWMFQKLFVLYPTKNIWMFVDFNSTRVCVRKPGFCSTDGRLFWGSKRDAKPEDAGSGAPAKLLLHTIAPSDGACVSPTQGFAFLVFLQGLKQFASSWLIKNGVYLKHYKKTKKKSDTCNFLD